MLYLSFTPGYSFHKGGNMEQVYLDIESLLEDNEELAKEYFTLCAEGKIPDKGINGRFAKDSKLLKRGNRHGIIPCLSHPA
jgi:hypothetical protein